MQILFLYRSQCSHWLLLRSNGYYSSFTYFSSKVLFDILPLRVVPPLLFGGIVYGLVGLVPSVSTFWKFLFVLVLFNLTTASVVLLISVACESTSVGNLVGTLVMLFKYVAYHSSVTLIAHGLLQLVVHWSPYQS